MQIIHQICNSFIILVIQL